jgi:HAD superfamily hydrolase (TIGR01549 family)
MTIQGMIFDLGHTLMHLDGTWPEMFEHGMADLAAYLDEQNLDLDSKSFAQALLDRRKEGFAQAKATQREVTAEDSMRWAFDYFGLPNHDPALRTGAIDAFFAYETAHWLADPQALPLLRDLAARGLRLGMFSNATHDPFIQRLVDRFGFRPWLDPALSSAGTGIRKPDPEAFAPILAAWNLPPESVVMVGDSLNADILGAQRAGMGSAWIRAREDARQEGDGYNQAGQPDPVVPDATITRLDELPGLLAGWQ